jgi:hypothetical protein
MLIEKITKGVSGIVTYGFSPPKKNNTDEKIKEIAQGFGNRIAELDIDAVVLYDIQDETDRISDDRPFPFLPTLDPHDYSNNYLSDITKPKIIYRSIGKYTREQFISHLEQVEKQDGYHPEVFVGASSGTQNVSLKLAEAYQIIAERKSNVVLGGVTIPERHQKKHDEHLRITQKANSGCQFFVSQGVYNVQAAKNMLSDYYYHCQNNQLTPAPILFTLAPCGSAKTITFMKWLGISIPKWLENDLLNSQTMLEDSVKLCLDIFENLYRFAADKNMPIGFNIESLSIRKTEIDASVELTKEIINRIKRYQQISEEVVVSLEL